MIDFPPGTTVGQTFAASNGITYMWTGTIWVATAGGTSPGGDFFATGAGGSLNTSTLTALGALGNIISGNALGSYSSGRYTPPAGRFCIYGWVDASTNSAAGVVAASLSKNGTQILNARSDAVTAGAGGNASPYVQVTVDANGTDYFELRGYASTANTIGNIGFGGYPISGIKGPPGDLPTVRSIMLYLSAGSGGLSGTTLTMGWDVIAYNTTGGTYSGGSFTVPSGMGGIWDVNIQIQSSNPAASGYIIAALNINGAEIVNAGATCGPIGVAIVSGKFVLAVGDVVKATMMGPSGQIYYGSGGGARNSWMHLTRVGA